MTPTYPAPRVTTDRVARYIDAHRITDSGDSLACRIALDLLDARQQLAGVVETAMAEHAELVAIRAQLAAVIEADHAERAALLADWDASQAELMAARERIVRLDAALDAALLAIDQYHAPLFGEWRARGQA